MQYVEVIYMPEQEIQMVEAMISKEPRLDIASIHRRREEAGSMERINALFGRQDKT